ncbi:uroporphyrinogen decarboxylase family protein [Shigella flexneri]
MPVTLFTKGGGQWLEAMAETGCDALGLTGLRISRMRAAGSVIKWPYRVISDPSMLYAPPARIEAEVASILAGFGQARPCVQPRTRHPQDVPPEHAGAFTESVHRLSAKNHRQG